MLLILLPNVQQKASLVLFQVLNLIPFIKKKISSGLDKRRQSLFATVTSHRRYVWKQHRKQLRAELHVHSDVDAAEKVFWP